VELIEEAVTLLRRHPLIGRPVEQALRELVISRGKTGYSGFGQAARQLQEGLQRVPRGEEVHGEVLTSGKAGIRQRGSRHRSA
jgi:hypothetical protein